MTDEKQTLMSFGPNDNTGARDTVDGYERDETPEMMSKTYRLVS